MPDVKNRYGPGIVINFVNYSVGPDANPPAFPARKFPASWRSRILGEGRNRLFQLLVSFLRQNGKFTLSPAKNEEGVAHLRERSISYVAFRKAMAWSPESFAAS
jgi:hypothetical protein